MTRKKQNSALINYNKKNWKEFPTINISLGNMKHNKTGSWRFIKPVYEDKTPPCQEACPAGNDIEGWIKLIQKGEYKKALWHLKREEPFPAIMGRVCFKFCETRCNRAELDQPIDIKELERFTAQQVPVTEKHPDLKKYNGKTLAVIGSGPAGMSAAYFSRLLGFKVTIYEKLPVMGGLLVTGIPEYRLPDGIVKKEFKALKKMGIELKPGIEPGRDFPFEELYKSFDYIFLATGNNRSLELNLGKKIESPHIMSGIELLKKIALKERVNLSKKIIVIGGGNTAIDAARTCVRLGKDVTIIYRRNENQMPAHVEEIMEAKEEGIKFLFNAAPENITLNKNSSVKNIICFKTEPADKKKKGKLKIKKGSQFKVEAGTVIYAIGETCSLDFLKGKIKYSRGFVKTDLSQKINIQGTGTNVFAGGDITGQQRTVIHAIASGKRAAIAMDCQRNGKDFNKILQDISINGGPVISFSRYMDWLPLNPVQTNFNMVVGPDKIVYDYFIKMEKHGRHIKEAALRKKSFEPYTKTINKKSAKFEADRCIHCGRCTECDNCVIFCPDLSVKFNIKGRFGYKIDYEYCKGCGICETECPRLAITMIDEEVPLKEEKN